MKISAIDPVTGERILRDMTQAEIDQLAELEAKEREAVIAMGFDPEEFYKEIVPPEEQN